MKIAILLGASEYENKYIIDLPGCSNDIKLIYEILNKTNNYEEILVLENKTALITKKNILSFVSNYEKSKIDEFFFYFTGHGININDEYYYLLNGFDRDRLRQTSLENSEINKLIRTLNPALTVKLIDACYSGIPYIKSLNNNVGKCLAM